MITLEQLAYRDAKKTAIEVLDGDESRVYNARARGVKTYPIFVVEESYTIKYGRVKAIDSKTVTQIVHYFDNNINRYEDAYPYIAKFIRKIESIRRDNADIKVRTWRLNTDNSQSMPFVHGFIEIEYKFL